MGYDFLFVKYKQSSSQQAFLSSLAYVGRNSLEKVNSKELKH